MFNRIFVVLMTEVLTILVLKQAVIEREGDL
jgi:hypothetical protein